MKLSPISLSWKAALVVALSFAVAGCETGKTDKNHPAWLEVSDVTTTAPATAHPPTKDRTIAAEEKTGQPMVPGSPTASNADGTQPPHDQQARPQLSEEHGSAEPPRQQPTSQKQRNPNY